MIADFKMPDNTVVLCTACWRGYTAQYRVTKEKLYGERYEWDYEKHKDVVSERLFVNYTGSCVIARAKDRKRWLNSDFLEYYLNYDEALELHFTDGILDGVRDLSEAIELAKEGKLFVEDEGEAGMNSQAFGGFDFIARKMLKYKYDYRTYKWR